MRQNKNSSDFAKTTQDFPIANNFNLALKTRLILACFVLFIFTPIFLMAIFFLSRIFEAKRRDAEKERAIQKTISFENDNPSSVHGNDSEKKINHRTEVKFANFLQENWQGILEVKDWQSLTMKNKQAGIKTENGIVLLKNKVYIVYKYFVYADKGYGIAVNEEKTLAFSLVWHTGITKPPANIKTIFIPAGQQVEIGKLY